MNILRFIKEYWSQLLVLIGILGMLRAYILATRCSLRNDMLMIWDMCKDKKQITKYQLESFMESRDLYYKLKGDGFIHAIDDKIQRFEIID